MPDFVEIVARAMNEPRPRPPQWTSIDDISTPIDRACAGLRHAMHSVHATAHKHAVTRWRDRQRRLRGWLDHLRQPGMPEESPEDVGRRLGEGEPLDDVLTAAFGTPLWEEFVVHMKAIFAEAEADQLQLAETYTCLADASNAMAFIIDRSKERMAEIANSAEGEINAPANITDSERNSLIAKARNDVLTVSETAVAKINAQTRQVLDIGSETPNIKVQDWLRLKGLSAS